jgi:hypothetical protein
MDCKRKRSSGDNQRKRARKWSERKNDLLGCGKRVRKTHFACETVSAAGKAGRGKSKRRGDSEYYKKRCQREACLLSSTSGTPGVFFSGVWIAPAQAGLSNGCEDSRALTRTLGGEEGRQLSSSLLFLVVIVLLKNAKL